MLKLEHQIVDSITLAEMKLGQVGVIVNWGSFQERVGNILFRGLQDKWFNLSTGECWTPPPESGWEGDYLRVTILPHDALLKVDY